MAWHGKVFLDNAVCQLGGIHNQRMDVEQKLFVHLFRRWLGAESEEQSRDLKTAPHMNATRIKGGKSEIGR